MESTELSEWIKDILGAFSKLRKATISFVMSVHPSIRPSFRSHGSTQLPLKGFSLKWHLSIFRNAVKKIQASSKSDKSNVYFTWKPIYIYDNIPRLILLRLRNVSEQNCCNKQNQILCSVTLFRKSCRLWGNADKMWYSRAIQGNTAQTVCMLGTVSYIHIYRICNTYCFSTAAIFMWNNFNVTFIRTLPVLHSSDITKRHLSYVPSHFTDINLF
jgi:hypothetical protein